MHVGDFLGNIYEKEDDLWLSTSLSLALHCDDLNGNTKEEGDGVFSGTKREREPFVSSRIGRCPQSSITLLSHISPFFFIIIISNVLIGKIIILIMGRWTQSVIMSFSHFYPFRHLHSLSSPLPWEGVLKQQYRYCFIFLLFHRHYRHHQKLGTLRLSSWEGVLNHR